MTIKYQSIGNRVLFFSLVCAQAESKLIGIHATHLRLISYRISAENTFKCSTQFSNTSLLGQNTEPLPE